MNNGWIKIHRKLLDNPIYNDPHLLHLFIHCVLKANHKEQEFLFNNELMKVKRGQFITGRFQLGKELNQNPSSIYKRLKILEKLEILNIKSNNKFSVITVLKYNTYQDEVTTKEQQKEQQSNNKVTTKEQQSNTNNNDKNEDNDNNEKKETKTLDTDFEKFWNLYDKKVGDKNKVIKKFSQLKTDDKNKIFETLPDYIISTPDKKFRKNPETYLNNHSWNDEIIKFNQNGNVKPRRNDIQEFKPINQL